ncbi:Polyprenol reductase [Lachnellula hyalina]|uniref:Polyprenal reductase n=1 Tax=Lachnellula hyalina TaxID=1316788 RepID=A0A8H8R7C5_9HELO|nr:Polyprenol reductase [Lachnellula hyalina]TVY29357.1 Polyprenol reductase [Lachnellula hyalina]
MDPATLCKAFFAVGTAVDLGGILLPSFRENIMNYGSRGSKDSSCKPSDLKEPPNTNQSTLTKTIEKLALYQVPHPWFTHYYLVSVASSAFWGYQIFTGGAIVKALAARAGGRSGMTANQVVLAWASMGAQGGRRLYESVTLTKASKTVLSDPRPITSLLEFSKPSLKTAIGVPLFISASALQNDCHKHLASLKKYSLPQRGPFKQIVCPHYMAECLIYVSLAIISAPPGQALNKTVLAGLGFVVTNLGVTADSTKKWYGEKFGAENVEGRCRMIPYLY